MKFRRLLPHVAIAVAALMICGFALRNRAFRSLTRQVRAVVEERAKAADIAVRSFEVNKASFESLSTAAWRDARIVLSVPEGRWSQQPVRAVFRAERVVLRPRGAPWDMKLEFGADNVTFDIGEMGLNAGVFHQRRSTRNFFRIGKARMLVPLNVGSLGNSLEQAAAELQDFVQEGVCDCEIELTGLIQFEVKGGAHPVRLFTRQQEGKTVLLARAEDLNPIARVFGNLSPREVGVLADHPTWVMALLRLKEYAAEEAVRIHAEHPDVPEVPYRHVLWSYLLTKRFGEAAAREITDGHEDKAEESRGEHRQHTDNSAMGRYLASKGVSEKHLPMWCVNRSRSAAALR